MKSHNSGNQGFSYYFCLMAVRIRIREAQKHMDPTDPDPQHCPKCKNSQAKKIKIIKSTQVWKR